MIKGFITFVLVVQAICWLLLAGGLVGIADEASGNEVLVILLLGLLSLAALVTHLIR